MRSARRTWARRLCGRIGLLAASALLLAACSSDRPKPASLDELTPKIAGRQVWRIQLDRVSFPLAPAVREGRVFVAGDDGVVRAVDALSGALAW